MQPRFPLQIFRAGRHQAMDGSVIEFSADDLAATARAYDPSLHEAPLTVGHPATNGPAYGWVRSLAARDVNLDADPHQVDPEFAEMVNSGKFKKISASFYLPNAPANPVPGVYYLRHVGFLGAQPPAVKGLRDAAFADAEGDTLTVEFGEMECRLQADLWTSLREWLIAQFGLEKADQAISRYTVDALREIALREIPLRLEPSDMADATVGPAGFSEPPARRPTMPDTSPDVAALEARRAEFAERERVLAEQSAAHSAREAELAAREAVLREQEEAARRRGLAAFAEGLAAEGKLLPRDLAWACEFMAAIPAEQTVSFGEGDAAQTKPLLASFQEFLSGLPKLINYGEVAGAPQGEPEDASFAAPPAFAVDGERLELHRQAVAYQKANPGTDYVAAVRAVSN